MICQEYVTDEIFTKIREVGKELGVKAYVVGGYVRDQFLGVSSKDIDVTIVGNSHIFADTLKDKLHAEGDTSATVSVFETYGTAQLKSVRYGEVEFVTARNESYSRDSRNPECHPGTLDEDLRRRDLTINAMAISLNEDSYGELVDMFGGRMDLMNKIAKTPIDPSMTYSDDPLRMLRTIRFATKYNLTIDDTTYSGIRQNAHRIKIIVPDRIHEELGKIMSFGNTSYGIHMLFETGLVHHIFKTQSTLKTEYFGEYASETMQLIDKYDFNANSSKKFTPGFASKIKCDLKWCVFIHSIVNSLIYDDHSMPDIDAAFPEVNLNDPVMKRYEDMLVHVENVMRHPTQKEGKLHVAVLLGAATLRSIWRCLYTNSVKFQKEHVDFIYRKFLMSTRNRTYMYDEDDNTSELYTWEMSYFLEYFLLSAGNSQQFKSAVQQCYDNHVEDCGFLGSFMMRTPVRMEHYFDIGAIEKDRERLENIANVSNAHYKIIIGYLIKDTLHLKQGKLYSVITDMAEQEILFGRLNNTKEDLRKFVEGLHD